MAAVVISCALNDWQIFTNRISMGGNAVTSVHPSVSTCLLNRLIFDPDQFACVSAGVYDFWKYRKFPGI